MLDARRRACQTAATRLPRRAPLRGSRAGPQGARTRRIPRRARRRGASGSGSGGSRDRLGAPPPRGARPARRDATRRRKNSSTEAGCSRSRARPSRKTERGACTRNPGRLSALTQRYETTGLARTWPVLYWMSWVTVSTLQPVTRALTGRVRGRPSRRRVVRKQARSPRSPAMKAWISSRSASDCSRGSSISPCHFADTQALPFPPRVAHEQHPPIDSTHEQRRGGGVRPR